MTSLSLNTTTEVGIESYEKRTSAALNDKDLGTPLGIYHGFTPTVLAGTPATTVQVDVGSKGYSVARVESLSAAAVLTVKLERAITINMTALDGTATTYLKIEVDWTRSGPTTARIYADTVAPDGRKTIGICRIQQAGAGLDFTINSGAGDLTVPTYRSQPNSTPNDYALVDQTQITAVNNAAALVTEVTAARTGVDAVTSVDLQTRLAADFGSVQNRLARNVQLVRGEDVSVGSSANSVVISPSFGSQSRSFEPKINIASGGLPGIEDGSTVGQDGFPTVAADNYVALVNPTTNRSFLDDDGKVIFGVLSSAAIVEAISTTFTNASTTVTGASSYATFAIGDLIYGNDGEGYEISNVSGTTITLAQAYQGTTATVASVSGIRVTLGFRVSDGAGSVSVHTTGLSFSETMRPFFKIYSELDTLNEDHTVDLIRSIGSPRELSADEYAAISGASSPGSGNVFLTSNEINLVTEAMQATGYVKYTKNGTTALATITAYTFSAAVASETNVDTFKSGKPIATIAGGIITLAKPSTANLIYEYELIFSGRSSSNNLMNTVWYQDPNNGTTPILVGAEGAGSGAAPINESAIARVLVAINSASSATEVVYGLADKAGATSTPDDTTSVLYIKRRGRIA